MGRFGKSSGIAKAGLQFLPPYSFVAYVVTQKTCTYVLPVNSCITADEAMVDIDVVLAFAISDPETFVYRIGAEQFNAMLGGVVGEHLRLFLRSQSHDAVCQLDG